MERPDTSLEPTPVTPAGLRCGFPVGGSRGRRGSVLARYANQHAMQKKRQRMPDAGMGKFCIVAGCAMAILPLFASRLDLGQRCSAAGAGFMGLAWGLSQVAGAKRWRQKYGEPSLEEQMAIKKSHSISNLPKLLAWLGLSIAALYVLALVFVMLFHH